MNKEKRHDIFERLAAANPQPTTELEYAAPFELLVAVMLSAQATDVGVNKATARLFARRQYAARPSVDLGVEGLKPYIKTIGLFNTKAQNIIATCAVLIEQHGGQVPRQTAPHWKPCPASAARRPTSFSTPPSASPPSPWTPTSSASPTAPAWRRARPSLAGGGQARAVRAGRIQRDAHHWLILHGRYVCVARKPRCGACVIEDLCEYKHKTE